MPKGKAGRPTKYNPELGDKICQKLAHGKSLRSVCAEKGMPVTTTVFNWMRKYPEFREQYAIAKEESADAMAEELLDIADDGSNDWMEQHDAEGKNIGWRLNGEHVQRSRLRADTRKWLMAKMKPKKYGDKVTTEHTGHLVITDLTDDELDRRIAQLSAQQKPED